ncbi:S-adenosyl-L-methionine-dependent methyltransferase [Neolentinus lepideus HHB14362 ss-1]|uniref:S-adenosyl-L-methionine-dependent methyltransferase n=1 Tax=Neolentinus lepideus HHB14362 ss-1 TaxID=1314782 RepID=A0A165NKD5_9AGAM|nr:S-adenosyl-L-methionine-dependent methyltransferase [Neolentinus lepideus HHB14362 ss-1]
MSAAQQLSQLKSLQETLNAAIDTFKAELEKQELPEPSLTTSKPHPIDEISYIPTPAMYEARRAGVAASTLIKYLLESPYDALSANTWMTLECSSIRLAADLGIADILTSCPNPEVGLSVEEIAKKTDVDAIKLERVLRLLVSQCWFRETQPGYFANNRRSLLIQKSQPAWHLVTFMNEMFHRISSALPEHINNPSKEFRFATDPHHTAWNIAYSTELPYFGANSWLTKNLGEAERFGLAMGAVGPTSDPGVAADFPWAEIAEGRDAIVDVGGGQGTLCCSLAARYPSIKQFIVQDLPETRAAAEPFIASKGLTGRVIFEAQDFFKPQRRKGTGNYVFVMQRVLHDWPTSEGAKMLSQIRDALKESPKSVLLIVDTIIQPGVMSSSGPAAKDSLKSQDKSQAYKPIQPPPFIPVDFGDASRISHQINVALTAMCNTFERTLPQLQEMVELAGLKIKEVHATRGWASITEVVLP